MDRELTAALRAVKRTGRMLELFELLLEDASWSTLVEMGKMLVRIRKSYRAGRITKAFSRSRSRLMGYKMVASTTNGDLELPLLQVTREGDEVLVFHTEWVFQVPESPLSAQSIEVRGISLLDDEGFCFGLRNFHLLLFPGDILRTTYQLKMKGA